MRKVKAKEAEKQGLWKDGDAVWISVGIIGLGVLDT
jgi:hypothetical protein